MPLTGYPRRVLGYVAKRLGRLDEAVGHRTEYLKDVSLRNLTVYEAYARYELSESLLERDESGDKEKAVELQDEAIAIAQELGMKPLVERVLAKREILKA